MGTFRTSCCGMLTAFVMLVSGLLGWGVFIDMGASTHPGMAQHEHATSSRSVCQVRCGGIPSALTESPDKSATEDEEAPKPSAQELFAANPFPWKAIQRIDGGADIFKQLRPPDIFLFVSNFRY